MLSRADKRVCWLPGYLSSLVVQPPDSMAVWWLWLWVVGDRLTDGLTQHQEDSHDLSSEEPLRCFDSRLFLVPGWARPGSSSHPRLCPQEIGRASCRES